MPARIFRSRRLHVRDYLYQTARAVSFTDGSVSSASGDYAIVFAAQHGSQTEHSTPSGWSKVATDASDSFVQPARLYLWTRTLDGTETSVNFADSAGSDFAIFVIILSGFAGTPTINIFDFDRWCGTGNPDSRIINGSAEAAPVFIAAMGASDGGTFTTNTLTFSGATADVSVFNNDTVRQAVKWKTYLPTATADNVTFDMGDAGNWNGTLGIGVEFD